jgi:hypothetical protein
MAMPTDQLLPAKHESPAFGAGTHHIASQTRLILGALGTALLCAFFTGLYWNRFLAASAGGTFFYLGEQILKGRLPYRDIFLVVTPLQAFKMAALIRLFGDQIIVARAESLFERVLLGVMIYFLLTRYCKAASATLASFLTIVVTASDPADALINYHVDSVFWAVAAAMCLTGFLSASTGRSQMWLAAGSGVFSALSLLTKQTTGAGIVVALAIVMIAITWKDGGMSNVLGFAIPFGVAWLFVIAVFVGWLVSVGALVPFLNTVLMTNTSKGRPLAVLTRIFTQFSWAFQPMVFITPLLAIIFSRFKARKVSQSLAMIVFVIVAGVATLTLILLSFATKTAWPGTSPISPVVEWQTGLTMAAEMFSTMLAFTGSAYIFLNIACRWVRRPLTLREKQIWLMSAVSFATAYMLSLSWAIYSPMVAPGLALVTGLALDRCEASSWRRFAALSSVVFVIIYGAAGVKLMRPFAWMAWYEPPVGQATHASSLPKLAGLRVEGSALALTEDITHLVQAHTKPGDSLLVYPYFPLFYSLTDLDPPTRTFNHYLDVCPDQICIQDAVTILEHPPDAIVYMVEDEALLAKDEAIFRSGRRSGSRAVAQAIEKLAGSYQKLLSAPLPGSSRVIEVYAKH